jgi:hypothetical protein
LALLPSLAQAHGDIEGLNRFVAGGLHPLLVPAHAVALLALGLLVGQRGLAVGHHALTALLLALLASLGMAATTTGIDLDTLVLVVGAGCAIAVVTALAVPAWLLGGAAAMIGVGVGLGSAPEGADSAERWAALAGTGLGAFLVVSLVAAVVDNLRASWTRVGLRVVGSWLAASALLVLALAAVGPTGKPGAAPPVAGVTTAR